MVLFPGVPLPLHIFEPRYRQMLNDIRAGNSLFGLSYFDASTAEHELPLVGSVGCVAKVTDTQPFADGRSNILTVGVIRYRIEGYVERGDPYLVARVNYFEDDDEDSETVQESSREVAEIFTRIARAVQNHQRRARPSAKHRRHRTTTTFIPGGRGHGSGHGSETGVARTALTSERLRRLRDILARAVSGYEERARVHELAKGNGHSGKKIEME